MKYEPLFFGLLLFGFTACEEAGVQPAPGDKDKPTPPVTEPEPQPVTGCELWKDFVTNRRAGTESVLPDFSYAGYAHGEQPIPDVTDYPVFDVTDYGAVANDGISDREAFEQAIAEAVKAQKGIIRFPAGRYDLRPADAPNAPIIIDADNIILRGAGSGEGGTELFMEYPNQVLDNSLWNTPELISFRYVRSSDRQLAQITGNAPRGGYALEVSSTGGLHIGQRVILKLKNNDPELIADELAPYDVLPEWSELTNSGVQVTEYHQIKRIEGHTVTFKEPVLHKVDARWGWTLHEHSCHTGIGVEDIAFTGNFQEDFKHHQNALHDSGFRLLTLQRAVNSWVRRCRFTNVSEGLSVMLCANVTVHSCDITGRQGHSAIRSQASSRVFIGKINDLPAQFHSVGVSKTAIGTVLWRNRTAANSCFESHASQPRATLLDACEGGFLPNHAGGDASAGPNHMADLVLWNYRETDPEAETDFDLWARNNRFLLPIIAGFHGTGTTFRDKQLKACESHSTKVEPESLYEAQLAERLGYLPQWLEDLK